MVEKEHYRPKSYNSIPLFVPNKSLRKGKNSVLTQKNVGFHREE